MPRMPPLSAVRAFEAAARCGSFTRAAEELSVTQAAVSYQIRLLEARVGAALFQRTGRRVTLSAVGRRLAPTISQAFESIATAFAAVDAESNRSLTVTTVASFASNWLAPRLGSFRARHPDLSVRVIATDATLDFEQDSIDVAVRAGDGPWPKLEAHRLFSLEYTPIVSAALLARFGPIERPEDLLRLPFVAANDPWWPRWFEAAGAPGLAPPATGAALNVEGQQIEGRMVLAGGGVALLTASYWQAELASGVFVSPFETVVDDGRAYWLVYPKARRALPKVRAFRTWLLEQIGDGAADEGP